MTGTRLPKENNFDLLRLLFAVSVFVTHLYELSGSQVLKLIPITLSYAFLTSGRAVQGFFVISGFLIFMSYEHSKTLKSYVEKRARRLLPGYIVNVILVSLLLSLLSNLGVIEYFRHSDFVRYALHNLFFLNDQWTLPGVFTQNKLPAVNGALWTLQLEVLFYIAVPFIVLLGKFLGRLPVIALLYILSAGYLTYLTQTGEMQASLSFLPQLCFFLGGALCYYGYPWLARFRYALLTLAIGIFVVDRFAPGIDLLPLYPLAVAYCTVFLACFIPYLGNIAKYGDFSYGSYIYHFPIIQALLALRPYWHPLELLLTALICVFGAAIASWHLLEKRFLLRSSHYVHVAAKG